MNDTLCMRCANPMSKQATVEANVCKIHTIFVRNETSSCRCGVMQNAVTTTIVPGKPRKDIGVYIIEED